MDAQFLASKASQETLISLLQLDPAPMDTDEKPLPPLPEESSGSSKETDNDTSSIALNKEDPKEGGVGEGPGGPGGPNLIHFLTRCQRYSTYILPIFTTLHLTTTSLIPLLTRSVPASEKHLLLAREIYQTPLSEPTLILIPALAHVASGISLRLLRRSHNLRKYGGATPALHAKHGHGNDYDHVRPEQQQRIWPPLTWIGVSGYAFTGFLAAHVSMNRVLPLLVEGDSSNIGLAYVAHGFARHSFVSTAAYVGLLGFGCGHMTWGAAKWLGLAGQAQGWGWGWGWGRVGSGSASQVIDKKTQRRRKRVWIAIHALAAGWALLWAAGGLGVVARGGLMPGWIGDVYDDLYSKVWL